MLSLSLEADFRDFWRALARAASFLPLTEFDIGFGLTTPLLSHLKPLVKA